MFLYIIAGSMDSSQSKMADGGTRGDAAEGEGGGVAEWVLSGLDAYLNNETEEDGGQTSCCLCRVGPSRDTFFWGINFLWIGFL